MPTGAQEADEDAPSGENTDRELRKNRLSISLALGRRKKRKTDALDPYRKFVAFYTRSENPFVNYYSVLDAGMAWEASQFGDLSRDEFGEENAKLLHVYRRLRSAVPQFTRDFYELRQASEELEALQKQLNDVVTAARGADIHSLREKGISYIELEQPDKQITPRLDPAAPKSSSRGHNHAVLSRLLCPVEYLTDFDTNPAEFQIKLQNNKVRVVAGDFSALLYPHDGFDPDDLESGLFRNPILLRFYKHIFTAPSSARQDLTVTGSRPKIKRPQAMLNDMKAVTPGSIVYAALMLRHCISSLDDWRTEDDLFKREEFFDSMVSLLDDPEDDWAKDTLKWWNNHVFGTLYSTSDDEQNRAPSTAELLREKRAARKEKQREVAKQPQTRERTPGFSSPQPRRSQPLSLSSQQNPDSYRPYAGGSYSGPYRPRYDQPPPSPLHAHNDNVPSGSSQYYRNNTSSPARNRDRDRSRSPPYLQKTSSVHHGRFPDSWDNRH